MSHSDETKRRDELEKIVKTLLYLYEKEVYGYVHEGYGELGTSSESTLIQFNALGRRAQELDPTFPDIKFDIPEKDDYKGVNREKLMNAIKFFIEMINPDPMPLFQDYKSERKEFLEEQDRIRDEELKRREESIKSVETESFKYDIFLSYTTRDADVASELKKMFEDANLKCFMALTDLTVGADWSEDIRDALRHSSQVMLLITPNSLEKEWPFMETGAAWVLDKKILPALINVDMDDLPAPVKKHQARVIETIGQRKELVKELSGNGGEDEVEQEDNGN